MASKSKVSTPVSQPDISNYIQRQRTNSNKRLLSSPTDNQLNKKAIMEVTAEVKDNHRTDKLINLPPDLKLLYDSLSVCLDSIDRKIDPNLSSRVEHVETKQLKTEARLFKVEKENEELKQRLVSIEDKLLENSVVINGISEEKFEEPEPCREKLNKEIARILSGNSFEEKLENAKSLQIESTDHVGKFNPAKGRPIAVKFTSKNDVEMLLKNKKSFSEGIFVVRLYSTETDKERRRLRPILSAARRLEEYRGRCKMEGKDLIIRGKCYSFENLSELPQNLSPEVVSCRQDALHYGFFGEFNPLSNFHPAVFTYNGTRYNHTEQFIQATKAEFCNDNETLNEIMSTTSALKCKELGHSVKNCNIQEWNKKAKELCFPGILCKFQQNGGLAAFLKNMGDKTLLECCYDTVWGNGIPLSSPDCIKTNKYKYQGIQGEMLEEIRAILQSAAPVHVESASYGNNPPDGEHLHVETALQHD